MSFLPYPSHPAPRGLWPLNSVQPSHSDLQEIPHRRIYGVFAPRRRYHSPWTYRTRRTSAPLQGDNRMCDLACFMESIFIVPGFLVLIVIGAFGAILRSLGVPVMQFFGAN